MLVLPCLSSKQRVIYKTQNILLMIYIRKELLDILNFIFYFIQIFMCYSVFLTVQCDNHLGLFSPPLRCQINGHCFPLLTLWTNQGTELGCSYRCLSPAKTSRSLSDLCWAEEGTHSLWFFFFPPTNLFLSLSLTLTLPVPWLLLNGNP